MNELELDFRIKCLLSRLRNIIYYRSIDNRPRCQYIHVVRKFRQDVRELSINLPDIDKYKDIKTFFKIIVLTIPSKVKSEECEDIIMKLAELSMSKEEISRLPRLQISENQVYDE